MHRQAVCSKCAIMSSSPHVHASTQRINAAAGPRMPSTRLKDGCFLCCSTAVQSHIVNSSYYGSASGPRDPRAAQRDGRSDCHVGLVVSRRGRAQHLALHGLGACAPAGAKGVPCAGDSFRSRHLRSAPAQGWPRRLQQTHRKSARAHALEGRISLDLARRG